jgi:p-methyltransferase
MTNPMKLSLDERVADIQVVINYIQNDGQIVLPIEGDGLLSWSSAPKLNGIYLFYYLTRRKFNVELINSYYEERDIFCDLLQQTPRVVVISTTFIHSKESLNRLIDDIRSLAPDIFIIVGGPFIYLSYLMLRRATDEHYDTTSAKDDFLFLDINNEPSVDLYIVSLRGEKILLEALEKINQDQKLNDLPNTARLIGNTYSFTMRIDDISDAKDFAIDWDSLPDAFFKSGVVPMQASNGCHYGCAFCNFTKDRRLTSVKSLDQLIIELKAVSSRGVRYVWFVDDNFRLGKGDLSAVCQRFVDEELQVDWMSFIRASTLKDVNSELLRQAGCIEAQLGLESADSGVLMNMNKDANPTLYAEVVRKLLAVGIDCSCYFIFGFPGETEDTAVRTREFIKSIEHPELEGSLSWSLFLFIFSPMSPIYESEMKKKYGLTGYMQNWKHRTMDSNKGRELILETFLDLENSGPIYRGDNLDMIRNLTPHQRKKFVATRQKLSKSAMQNRLEKDDIIKSFTKIFSNY